ncbi:MAG: preprotein translocase subunit YajC [Janthinobacterium lividum]
MFFSPAHAQAAAASGGAAAFMQFVPLVAIFVIFYFLMIRPQQRRAKAHKAMLDAVKKGDEVVTGGGLIGRVTRVQDTELEVEVAPTVKLRVVKGTLSEVRTKPVPAAANDARN